MVCPITAPEPFVTRWPIMVGRWSRRGQPRSQEADSAAQQKGRWMDDPAPSFLSMLCWLPLFFHHLFDDLLQVQQECALRDVIACEHLVPALQDGLGREGRLHRDAR